MASHGHNLGGVLTPEKSADSETIMYSLGLGWGDASEGVKCIRREGRKIINKQYTITVIESKDSL